MLAESASARGCILRRYDSTACGIASREGGLCTSSLAATRRQPVTATYDGLLRLLCPHVLGRKSGRLHVFCYQFGGSSNSVEPLAPEGRGVWRCLAVERLSQVELRTDAWHTEPHSPRQTCIDEIDLGVATLERRPRRRGIGDAGPDRCGIASSDQNLPRDRWLGVAQSPPPFARSSACRSVPCDL